MAPLQTSRREEATEALKVAMDLVKRLGDLALPETVRELGGTSYGVVG